MKIITPGSLTPRWVGKHITCVRCHGVYELTVGDESFVHYRTERNEDIYYINCTTNKCNSQIFFS